MGNAKYIKLRSCLEEAVIQHLIDQEIPFEYEPFRIPYLKQTGFYTPDIILDNGVIIEIKGLFLPEDRNKHLLIKKQYPNILIHFVFQNSRARLSKKSRTTYAEWCEKHGFPYSERTIPYEWIEKQQKKVEIPNVR